MSRFYSANLAPQSEYRAIVNKRLVFPLCSWLTLSLLVASSLFGQVSETGLPAYGSFHGVGIDGVSLRNGNLHIEIPIVSVPERSSPNWGYKFVYDMPSWEIDLTHPTPTTSQWNVWPVGSELANWNLLTDANTSVWVNHDVVQDSCSYTDVNGQHTVQYQVNTNYYMVDSHGTRHPFELRSLSIPPGCGGITGSQTSGVALDGSGITMDTSANVSFPDNDGPFNGNQQETLGRTVLSTFTSQPDGNGNFYTLWTVHDSNGNPQQFRVDYSPGTGQTSFCSVAGRSNCYEYSNHRNFPQKLTLPTGQFYVFTWSTDGNADLLRIDLPTGGYISYGYQSYSWASAQHRLTQYMARRRVTSRTVSDGTTANTWTYTCNGSSLGCTVRDPLGNDEVHVFDTTAGAETQIKWYQGTTTSGTLLRTVNKDYSYEMSATQPDAINHGAINVRKIRETTILENGSQKKTETDYELFQQQFASSTYTFTVTRLNPTEVREFDYGPTAPGALLRTTDYTYLHTNNQNYISRNIVRNVLTKTVHDGSGTGTQVAQTVNEYDNYSHPGLPMLASNAVQHNSSYNTSFIYRGNVTAVSQWIKASNTFVTTTNQFDDAGNVVSTTDPLGKTTSFDYTDSWSNSSCAPSGQGKAYITKIINALNQVTTKTYNSCTGSLASTTDPNLQIVSKTYDMMGRTAQVSYPDTGSTKYCYTDIGGSGCTQAAPPLNVVKTTAISSSVNEISTVVFDGLGRVSKTQLNSDPDCSTGDITVTTYDVLGRIYTVSNPYCTTSDPTYGITTYIYDALGRPCVVLPPGGTVVSTCPTTAPAGDIFTSYAGRATSVQDEGNGGTAPVQRISQVDGLGRLTSVCEVTSATQLGSGGTPGACGQDIAATGFLTTYSYDVLGNLLTVNQGTLGQRTFAYDSLSRLLCAANPETGSGACPTPDNGTYTAFTTRYGYDANGNLTSRTRPAPNQASGTVTVATSYQYDALNRLTQKSYSDNVTPTAMYGYDQSSITMGAQQFNIANSIGRLSWECTIAPNSCPTMDAFSYDPMGRIAQLWESQQHINGTNLVFSYDYDLIGDELDYSIGNSPPGSTKYVSTYDGAGRLTSFTTPTWVDATNPANLLTGVQYDPFGHMIFGSLANGLSLSSAYDARGRVTAMAVGTTCANGNCSTNKYRFTTNYAPNSDVLSSTDTVNANWTYTYDSLNRLSTAVANNGQGCSWDYDRYGNRWHQNAHSGSCPAPQYSFSANNNRIDGFSNSYDADGNLFNDGSHSYQYDAENRITSVDGGATTYVYDAEGRRFSKTTGGVTVATMYDREGHPLFRTNNGPRELFAGGMHLGTYVVNSAHTDTIFYYDHSDWLGTERARTDLTGSVCETIANLPFGDNQTIATTCGDLSPLHFTGKERDSESGLDNFGARYFGSSLGRFMSADPDQESGIDNMGNPQMWNGYSYVGNNPLNATDPDGRSVYICVGGSALEGGTCTTVSDDAYNQAQQQDQYNHAPSLDQLKDSGQQGNLTDANGNVVGTVQYSPDDPKGAPVEGVNPEGEKILAGYAAGGIIGRAFGAAWGTVAGWFGRGAGTAAGEAAGQIGVRAGGIIDRIIPTAAGPVRVYAEVVAEGQTAVIKEVAVYPAASEGGLSGQVGYTAMRQGLNGVLSDLKAEGFTQARIEAWRSTESGVAQGTGRAMNLTVTLK